VGHATHGPGNAQVDSPGSGACVFSVDPAGEDNLLYVRLSV
jgi:hypothetical protein